LIEITKKHRFTQDTTKTIIPHNAKGSFGALYSRSVELMVLHTEVSFSDHTYLSKGFLVSVYFTTEKASVSKVLKR